ncbi:akirin-2-like [Sycon ciliatum]|uniref:akirin-2-like n=1 Tax=Sycon ciliatum TaxID=27933 RepID=UPI0020ABF802|eukprot:scpid72647/ scgid17248/ 
MACVALKRSHFDLQNTPTQDGCGEPSTKRRCSFAAMSSCQSSSPILPYSVASCSPIFQKTPVSRTRILEDVNGEIRMIRRRRRHFAGMSEQAALASPTSRKDRRQEQSEKSPEDMQSTKQVDAVAAKPEKPVFTAKQVADFCQRKLKEREEELKVLFDEILTARLTDQYDSFVRFTQDNLRQHFADKECSYVS